MAWLIRHWEEVKDYQPSRENPHPENDTTDLVKARSVPRCHGRVAMADAVIALAANLAMKHKTRIDFKKEWFDPYSSETPEAPFEGKA